MAAGRVLSGGVMLTREHIFRRFPLFPKLNGVSDSQRVLLFPASRMRVPPAFMRKGRVTTGVVVCAAMRQHLAHNTSNNAMTRSEGRYCGRDMLVEGYRDCVVVIVVVEIVVAIARVVALYTEIHNIQSTQ